MADLYSGNAKKGKKRKEDFKAPDLSGYTSKEIDANWEAVEKMLTDPNVDYESAKSIKEFGKFMESLGQVYYRELAE